jgi:hypothetical protein
MRRVNGPQQLNFAMRSRSHEIALRSLWHKHHLDHYLLTTHLCGEDNLLPPLSEHPQGAHTQGGFQFIGELPKIDHKVILNYVDREPPA